MNINDHAPVKATREARIEAAAETVWAVLLDIGNWPTWNRAVSRSSVEGSPAPGTVFRWKSGASSITSTLQDIDAPTRLSWTGRTFGASAVHVWTFTPAGSGVVVATSESFEGWLVRLFRGVFQRLLERALEDTLRDLKAACESQQSPGKPSAV